MNGIRKWIDAQVNPPNTHRWVICIIEPEGNFEPYYALGCYSDKKWLWDRPWWDITGRVVLWEEILEIPEILPDWNYYHE